MKALISQNMNTMVETTALTGLYSALLYMGAQFAITMM
jgi:hypothetical protein